MKGKKNEKLTNCSLSLPLSSFFFQPRSTPAFYCQRQWPTTTATLLMAAGTSASPTSPSGEAASWLRVFSLLKKARCHHPSESVPPSPSSSLSPLTSLLLHPFTHSFLSLDVISMQPRQRLQKGDIEKRGYRVRTRAGRETDSTFKKPKEEKKQQGAARSLTLDLFFLPLSKTSTTGQGVLQDHLPQDDLPPARGGRQVRGVEPEAEVEREKRREEKREESC